MTTTAPAGDGSRQVTPATRDRQRPLNLPGPGGAVEPRRWRLTWTDADGRTGASPIRFTRAKAESLAREMNDRGDVPGRVYAAQEDPE